jgi:hypothetical protein
VKEHIFMIGTEKMVERGSKYYQAMVGVGFGFANRRMLHRRWKTKTEAMKYLVDFYCTWVRLHKEV